MALVQVRISRSASCAGVPPNRRCGLTTSQFVSSGHSGDSLGGRLDGPPHMSVESGIYRSARIAARVLDGCPADVTAALVGVTNDIMAVTTGRIWRVLYEPFRGNVSWRRPALALSGRGHPAGYAATMVVTSEAAVSLNGTLSHRERARGVIPHPFGFAQDRPNLPPAEGRDYVLCPAVGRARGALPYRFSQNPLRRPKKSPTASARTTLGPESCSPARWAQRRLAAARFPWRDPRPGPSSARRSSCRPTGE